MSTYHDPIARGCTDQSKPKRRWFQFSLRTVLIVITVIAVWLGLKVNRAHQQARAVAAIQQAGGVVGYDYQCKEDKRKPKPDAQPWEPAWLLRVIGVDFFHEVHFVSLVYWYDEKGRRIDLNAPSDDLVAHLERLPRIKALFLSEGQVTDRAMQYVGMLKDLEYLYMFNAPSLTDEGVQRLSGLSNLKYVHLGHSQVTDRSVACLATHCPKLEGLTLQANHFTNRALEHASKLKQLKALCVGLGDCSINDDGLVHLKTLSKLETLDLQDSQVTDAGLDHLRGMHNLKLLWLNGTAVTDAGAANLQRDLPNLKISR